MLLYLGKHTRWYRGHLYRRDPASKWSGDRRYFKPTLTRMRQGVRALHVEVWKRRRGAIPAGHQIHHVDANTNRNRLKYLMAMPIALHQQHHAPVDLAARRAHLERIRPRKGTKYHTRGLATRARRRRAR